MAPDYKKITRSETKLINSLTGIANFITGNSNFKATEAYLGYHPEELDITLSNRDLESTKAQKIPKALTDHDLLHSEILL